MMTPARRPPARAHWADRKGAAAAEATGAPAHASAAARGTARLLILLSGIAAMPGASAQTASAPCGAAPAGAQTIAGDPVQAHWWPQPAAIAVSKPFAVRINLCPAGAQLLRVDATMPDHRHGMNYRTRLKPLNPTTGEWLAEGLVWHMPGRWELVLTVQADGKEHRLSQSVVLR
jgi:hypothetical protein